MKKTMLERLIPLTLSVSLALGASSAPALAARVDFTPTKDKDWSEVKLGQASVSEEKPLDMGQSNRIAFDFYYQPSAMTTGAFKTKIYMKTQDQKEVQAIADIDIKRATADKNGYQKVHVLVPFDTPEKPVIFFEVNLVGSETDYKGTLCVDNIALSYDDGYVARTVRPTKQKKLDLSQLSIPKEASLTDAKAIPQTASLYAFLEGIADSDYVLYGHMNDLLMHAGTGDSHFYVDDIHAVKQ
jgi:mannan endo-1,4-beta-mannosidase